MAGVALGDIYFRFRGRRGHLGHWAGYGGSLGLVLVGTWRHLPSFHVAGVAIRDIYFRFAW